MPLFQSLRQRLAGTHLEGLLRRAGLGALALRWYERRQLARGQQRITAFGLTMTFRTRSRSELTRIDLLGRDEAALCRRMLGCLRAGDAFFDVGANLGTLSVMVALHLGALGGGRVVACEPNPATLRAARENFALNGVTVTGIEAALGVEAGSAVLVLTGDFANGTDSLCAVAADTGARLTVPVRRGDEVAHTLGLLPNVLKVDVEGFEVAVLQGFFGTGGDAALREIFVEVHPQSLHTRDQSEATIIDLLAAQGFLSVWRAPRGTEVHHHFRRGGPPH